MAPPTAPLQPVMEQETQPGGASSAAPPPPATTRSSPPQVTALRLPPFAPDDPELWLAQVQCAFGVAGITSDLARYQVLASSLPADVASQVRDVITCSSPSYILLTSALRQRDVSPTPGHLGSRPSCATSISEISGHPSSSVGCRVS